MIQKNCLVIATALGALPGRILEALTPEGLVSTSEAEWKCFESASAAREWAAAKGIVVDGKRYIFAPYIPPGVVRALTVDKPELRPEDGGPQF